MTSHVTDIRSNANDQIAFAARIIGKSKNRRIIFETIYTGRKTVITVTELENKVPLISRKKITEIAGTFHNNHIIQKTKLNKELAYKKDQFFLENKKRILSLLASKEKRAAFPTKINPRINAKITNIINLSIPKNLIDIKQIYIDDIDSFSDIKKIKKQKFDNTYIKIYEKKFKDGIKKIFEEPGAFSDWGGEKNDLITTRMRIKKNRVTVAFAFKGRGTKGELTPKKMGKNGDQIQRLFSSSPAEVFLVQYCGEINESVLEQMKIFAISKSILEGKKIYYGIIDGVDTQKILLAYERFFK